ncbi:MarR family transcriptional regulator [Seinonella peptonophila]|nr:MarR family transcriptional regulator [Seinonella peptonophila]
MMANHAEIDVMTTSQILKLLEKKQWIERKQHPIDSPAKIIYLTMEGEVK